MTQNIAESVLICFQRQKMRNHIGYTCQLVHHIDGHLFDSYSQVKYI